MATIVNNPTPSERSTTYTDSGGWAIAIIILLLVIAAGAYLLTHLRAPTPVPPGGNPSTGTVNNNVVIPGNTGTGTPPTTSSGDTGATNGGQGY